MQHVLYYDNSILNNSEKMFELITRTVENKIKKEEFPLVEKLIDIGSYPVINVLDLLLQDKSTKKNIIWATDTYEELGEEFKDMVQMNAHSLLR